jgi:hypothetical protein
MLVDSHSAKNVNRVSFFRSEVEVGNVPTQTAASNSDFASFLGSESEFRSSYNQVFFFMPEFPVVLEFSEYVFLGLKQGWAIDTRRRC